MTFDSPNIAVSLNSEINETFTLGLGQRQTLIIPSDRRSMYLVSIRLPFIYKTIQIPSQNLNDVI